MPQSLIFILLMLALVLPVAGAIVMRLLAPRLSPPQFYGGAALIFAVAVIGVLVLARSNVSSLQVGGLSLLLPVAEPDESNPQIPPLPIGSPVPTPTLTLPAATPLATPVISETAAPTELPTALLPTTAPTETPTELPTELPTAAPTEVPPTAAPPPPPSRRTYTVQPGDTLRSIAAQFNVSVQAIIDANNLTPEQADSLRVGQELVIP